MVVCALLDRIDWLSGLGTSLGTLLGCSTRTRNASWQGKRHPVRNLIDSLGVGPGLLVVCSRSVGRSTHDGLGLVLLGLVNL